MAAERRRMRQGQGLGVSEPGTGASRPPAADDAPPATGLTFAEASRALSFIVAGVALPLLIAFAVKGFALHDQRDVSDAIAAAGGDAVTAMAWSRDDAGALFVGTQNGQLLRVMTDGRAEALQARQLRGPIVSIHPATTGAVAAVWADPRPKDGVETYYSAGVTSDGANGVPVLDGLVYDFEGGSAPVEAAATTSATLQAINPDQLKGPPGATQAAPRAQPLDKPARVSAVATFRFRADSSNGATTGFEDGEVRVSSSPTGEAMPIVRAAPAVPGSARPNGAILKIAASPTLAAGMSFVTAAADGTFVFYRGSSPVDAVYAYDAVRVLKPTPCVAADLFYAARDDVSPGTAIANISGVALARCVDGGVIVARASLPGRPDAPAEIVFRDYTPAELKLPHGPLETAGDQALAVQRALAARGFDPGPVDGAFGARTRRAFEQFRASSPPETRSDDGALDALLGARWRTSAAALSPRGDLFAVAGNDGVIRVVVLPEGRSAPPSAATIFKVTGHADVVTQLAISRDGRRLASLGIDGRLWIADLDGARARAGLPFYGLPSGPSYPDMAAVALRPLDGPAPARRDDKPFLVVYGTDASLEAAQDEVARARRAGFTDLRIFQFGGSYVTAATFATSQEQQEALPRLKGLSRFSANAYARGLAGWCPRSARQRSGGLDVTNCVDAVPLDPERDFPAQPAADVPQQAAPATDAAPPVDQPPVRQAPPPNAKSPGLKRD